MATTEMVMIKQVMDGAETISGTRDGNILAREAIRLLSHTPEGEVQLDFEGIAALTYSAACSFWVVLFSTNKRDVLQRLLFANVGESIKASLVHGLDCAEKQSETGSGVNQ